MKSLRLWITLLILWLIFFFNIERINSPINIRSYTYIFVAAVVALTLTLPKLQRLPFLVLLATPVPIFLVLKAFMERGLWYDNLLTGNALPLTVTQVSAILLTGLLARQIHYGLREFEDIIASITFGYIGKLPKPFSEGQGTIYREVKRARRFHRPLAIVALKVNEADIQVVLPKMVQEVQQAMMRQYVLAGVARILNENMHDFDTIALRDNNFILVLPEISGEEADQVAQKLADVVKERVKVKLQVGTANFPKEAMTFESLVELALENAQRQPVGTYTTPKQVTTQNLGDIRL
jgi:GGDEF domain-containing protein